MARLIGLFLAYLGTGWLGLQLPYSGTHITLVWLPTGIAVAALLVWGARVWPGIWLGAVLVNLLVGSSWPLALAISAGNTLGPLLCALWLQRLGFRAGFERQRDVVLFLAGACLGMTVSAFGGVLSLSLAGLLAPDTAAPAWLAWWMGDTVGVLLATPLLLSLTRRNLQRLWHQRGEALMWLLITAAVGWQIFLRNHPHALSHPLPLAFLSLPLLTWAALRFGRTGAALAALGLSLLAAGGTAMGQGVFLQPDTQTSRLLLWSYMATLVLTGLLITALLAERRVAQRALRDSEQRLRAIVETEPECVKVIDTCGNLVEMNAAGLAMIEAHSLAQAQQAGLLGLIEPTYRDAFAELQRRVLQGGSGLLEFEIRGLQGTHRWLETHAAPLRDAGGHITALLGITRDISERKRVEHDLRIAASAFEAQVGIVVTDTQGVILRVNQRFSQDSGYSAAEVVGQNPRLLKSGRHDHAFYANLWNSLHQHGAWQGEIWDRRKNGEIYPKWMTIKAVADERGAATHYVSTQMDITERKTAENEIRHLAYYDPLTLLPNRRLLLDRLRLALANSTRSGQQGALLFIDLDHFKVLNDTLGHDQGDLWLQQVAARLSACIRQGDTAARLGGDEFVVMLEDLGASPDEAADLTRTVGEKILTTLQQVCLLGETPWQGTSSMGIAQFGPQTQSLDELFRQADLAMYQAKAAGRNALRFFDPEMQAQVMRRSALQADLAQAIDVGQVVAWYQAQVDQAGRVTGAEVLARWLHPQRGTVLPEEFIALAEETGLIVPLGLSMLHQACQQLVAWSGQPEFAHLTLAVNMSIGQFRQAGVVAQVLAVLDSTGANPRRLKLELTESQLMNDVDDTIAKMDALKAHGVGFALDDFGTGYSSLACLKRLPLERIKIDRSFVMDVLSDANDAAIVKTILALADTLGLQAVAEGVEQVGQREFLAAHGCTAYQGYLFSLALPLAEFETLVQRSKPNPLSIQ